jgi:hypothetical protein
MESTQSSLGIMLKWIGIVAIPLKYKLVLLTKRPKFGKTFGKLRFLQNKDTKTLNHAFLHCEWVSKL